ncbi:uncharacterized protein LOC132007645 [Mustela nigripes]|uniref:uncharacterized protein LOC132007645 n=1 Tax=Mustela nigripes TaxID=77151 RepID=UPI002814C5B6|nr:uncharacterized protein LOC132007645 [Mustela nigripes]
MPPWPAWDWLPSGQRGDTLALQEWGVAVRKKSYRPFSVPGKGLLLPGLPSGVVPTASVPATAASLVLLSSQPRRWAARASWGRESPGCCCCCFFSSSRVLCSTCWGLADNELQGTNSSGSLGGLDVRRRIPIKLISKQGNKTKTAPRAPRTINRMPAKAPPGDEVQGQQTGVWTKSSPVFVKSYWNTAMPVHLSSVHGFFHTVIA